FSRQATSMEPTGSGSMQVEIIDNNGGHLAAIIYWYMLLKDAYCSSESLCAINLITSPPIKLRY
ncbi:hypothetical protein NSA47_13215, partial [Irregularibacter muris]|nr:hypothetical protein [Irregularibacter muris]